jgi:heme/copper-type cytochrome/quinol oxidase subunit 4
MAAGTNEMRNLYQIKLRVVEFPLAVALTLLKFYMVEYNLITYLTMRNVFGLKIKRYFNESVE